MNIRGRIAWPVAQAVVAAGYLQLAARGETRWTDRIPSHAYRPEWDDLWYLYRTVRRLKPRLILEFGPGATTRMMAAALHANGSGRIISIEAHQRWLEVARVYLSPELAERCELIHSHARLIERGGAQVWQHEHVPSVVPDLIYLDGPPLTQQHAVAVDVIDLEPRLQPGCRLVVDGRKVNFAYLQRHLQRQWAWRWNRLEYRGHGELLG